MPDHSAEIANIRAILNEGVTETVRDGITVKWDHDRLRRRLRELEAADDTHRGRRPVASSINLGGY